MHFNCGQYTHTYNTTTNRDNHRSGSREEEEESGRVRDVISAADLRIKQNIHNNDDDEYKQDGGDGAAWACVFAQWWERGDGFGDAKESRGWIVGEEE